MDRRVVAGIVGVVLAGQVQPGHAQVGPAPSEMPPVGLSPIPSLGDTINGSSRFPGTASPSRSALPADPRNTGPAAAIPSAPIPPAPVSLMPEPPIGQSLQSGYRIRPFSRFRWATAPPTVQPGRPPPDRPGPGPGSDPLSPHPVGGGDRFRAGPKANVPLCRNVPRRDDRRPRIPTAGRPRSPIRGPRRPDRSPTRPNRPSSAAPRRWRPSNPDRPGPAPRRRPTPAIAGDRRPRPRPPRPDARPPTRDALPPRARRPRRSVRPPRPRLDPEPSDPAARILTAPPAPGPAPGRHVDRDDPAWTRGERVVGDRDLKLKSDPPRELPFATLRAAAVGDEVITIEELERGRRASGCRR